MADRRTLLSILALSIVGAIVLFFKLGGHRTFGSHEVYAAVPAREMMTSGDWIVPRYGEVPRLRKPPLGYWSVAASATLFGGLNETTARLPSAICGGLLAVLMGVWSGRWYGRSVGLSAALVQLTSIYVIIFARKSEVDMLLCLLTTTAMFLVAGDERMGLRLTDGAKKLHSGKLRIFAPRWMLIFGLMGITCLAKFHFGLLMVGAPVVCICLMHRRWNMLPALINPVGWLLLGLGLGLWPYLVLQVLPDAWSVWKTETIGRMGELSHQPVWFYLPHLLWMTLPWIPLTLMAAKSNWLAAWGRTHEATEPTPAAVVNRQRERFLWVWFLTQLLIVSATSNKHKHYLLATLPVFSIWSGRQLAILAERLHANVPRPKTARLIGLATIWVIGPTVGAFVLAAKYPHLQGDVIAASTIMAIGGLLSLWLWRCGRLGAGLASLALSSLVVYMIAMSGIMPARDHRLPVAEFAQGVRANAPPNTRIYTYSLGMDPSVYYLNAPVCRLESAADLRAALQEDSDALVITYESLAPQLGQIGESQELDRMRIQASDRVVPKHPPLVLARVRKSVH